MLEVNRLKPILADMNARLSRIQPIAHLNSCRKLIENSWAPEFDAIQSLQPLKPYFNDPLHAILAKLFLLKFLYVIHKNNPTIPGDETNWIGQMRKNLVAQFAELCSQPNQQVTYNGKQIHTLHDLETLAQQRYTQSNLSFIDPDTVKYSFFLTCILNLINFQMGNTHPLGPKGYLAIAVTMLAATLVFGGMMVNAPPKLPDEVIAQNTLLQKSFLISDAELNQLNRSSLASRLYERFFSAPQNDEIVDDIAPQRQTRHQHQSNVGATRRK